MLKRFLTTALSLMLLAGAYAPASAQEAAQQDPQDSVTTLTSGQEILSGEWTPGEETNTVEESPLAKKMTQAEKNENAKENDSWGGAITIIAMSIVVSALIILSILFFIFGKISSALMNRKHRKVTGATKKEAGGHEEIDSGGAIAAIAMALKEHFSQEHDIETTILTLRRMKKAYSPWNSKIYNMRHLPDMPIHESHIPRANH